MQVTPNISQPVVTGFTIEVGRMEAGIFLRAIGGEQAFFEQAEAIREALGQRTIAEDVAEVIGEGHFDNDLLNGKRIAAIKRLRALFPSLGLKRAKGYMDDRWTLLRDANAEIDALAALRVRLTSEPVDRPLNDWEQELLTGKAAASEVCNICGDPECGR